ncbi:hypothetical protein BBOV_I002295 [Babesia bovis T2Bo]|uniref:hypothetical protein n=1 Tax=Babesia bovis T2Bo TaxID=484906 RepID=UPI001C35CE86|nr:hypothetical protein BBOV_I002295 [Babesia bovis T2Bo]KAG6440189.1 hypothetical protein BBOV_I002295 [Babesia bovis T2Bo]
MGKNGLKLAAVANAKCVKQPVSKGLPTKGATGAPNKRFDILYKWICFDLKLLQRLVYRNKSQYRSSAFMKSICTSSRFIKRLTTFIRKNRTVSGPSFLHDNEFNHLLYISLKSVLSTGEDLSRIHAHHFHVPLISVFLCIYGRLLYLLKRIPESLSTST